jgi:hypothetical protein
MPKAPSKPTVKAPTWKDTIPTKEPPKHTNTGKNKPAVNCALRPDQFAALRSASISVNRSMSDFIRTLLVAQGVIPE